MITKALSQLMVLLLLGTSFLQAQTAPEPNYRLAARFSPKKMERLLFSTTVDPHWLKSGDRFWYVWESPAGKTWNLVDAARSSKRPLFDHALMASRLSAIVGDPMDAQHLNIDSLRFVRSDEWIQFEVKSTQDIPKKDTAGQRRTGPPATEKKVYYFEYNLGSGELVQLNEVTRARRKPQWASVAPDGQTIVFVRNHNLYRMDRASYEKALRNEEDSTIRETQLTRDGIEHWGWGSAGYLSGTGQSNVDEEKNRNKRKSASVFWSPDSKKFVVLRTDVRKVKDLWVINSVAEPRPTLETYKYWMPGEKEAPVEYLYLFDAATGTQRELDVKQFKDQAISVWTAPQTAASRDDDFRPVRWHGTPDRFYINRTSRDLKRIDQCVVDIASGTVKPVVEERMNTYVEVRRPGLVRGGEELVEWSERDGWAHFYLYDGNGKLKNRITSGAYHCEDIVGIDEARRVLYFTANGREQGEDPYYLHLYRVNLDGSGLRLLNSGDFEHAVSMNDGERFFVDNFSRVNTVPRAALYGADGRKVMDLETSDFSSLLAAGYRFPEIFKVKADDGVTDLYGVLYKPFDFDSTKKYPVISYVYPGPQTEAVNKSFSRGMDRTDRLAQVGFIVVTVGNRGGHPGRSKWYHNFGYGNLRDYGLADRKAAIEQLADRYDFIDLDKVGIQGHSGGGFMSTAALLVYPDFFKVAVSNAGNHDNSIYNRWWSEKHHGVRENVGEKGDTSFLYAIERNPDLAKNLKGHLMLTHGDIDNNVHPANTIRMANALIKANKRFDLVLLPGQRHGYGDMSEYFFWRMADYFAQHLLGARDLPVDMEEVNRDLEQSGTKRRQ